MMDRRIQRALSWRGRRAAVVLLVLLAAAQPARVHGDANSTNASALMELNVTNVTYVETSAPFNVTSPAVPGTTPFNVTSPAVPGTTLVVPATTCGDGLRTGAEECDDANEDSNDGCSSYCVTEAGFTCKRPAAGGKDECSAIASPPAGSVFITASIRLGTSMTPEQFVGMCVCMCVLCLFVCLSADTYI